MSDGGLAARVAHLERRARRDRTFALGALVIALATAQAPPAAPPGDLPLVVAGSKGSVARIDANGLTVRDAAGNIRLRAGFDSDRDPDLWELDAPGTIRQAMYLNKGTPGLRQYDAAGKGRAALTLTAEHGLPEYAISDAAGTHRIEAFQGDKLLPEVNLNGSDGKTRVFLATDDVGAYFVMSDSSLRTRAYAGFYTNGSVGIDTRDTSGTATWSKP